MLVNAQVNDTLEVGFNDQEGVVEITRWPESFGKWSSYQADAELRLTLDEAKALHDHLGTIVAERGGK